VATTPKFLLESSCKLLFKLQGFIDIHSALLQLQTWALILAFASLASGICATLINGGPMCHPSFSMQWLLIVVALSLVIRKKFNN
jgi:hypothetical protein